MERLMILAMMCHYWPGCATIGQGVRCATIGRDVQLYWPGPGCATIGHHVPLRTVQYMSLLGSRVLTFLYVLVYII